ncbi:hypothetical protein KCU93_g9065, partial [Aureobasidium melanogenum]
MSATPSHALAMGEPFVRKTQEDEYLAARYYQIEAMLASALGALYQKSVDYRFRGMQWWAFDDEDTPEPWSGGDSHNAICDGWANRPEMRSDDEMQNAKPQRLLARPPDREGSKLLVSRAIFTFAPSRNVQEASRTRVRASVVLKPSANIWNGTLPTTTSAMTCTFVLSKVA